MQSFAILGSHPHISKEELLVVTGADLVQESAEVGVFEGIDVDLSQLQAKLAGMQKLGRIIGSFTKVDVDEIAEFLASMLISESKADRISYGVSLYELGDHKLHEKMKKLVHAIGMETKKKLKSYGHRARFVTGKSHALSSVIVTKNHLLQDGGEFCLFSTPKGLVIGQTESVQDFEDWSHRDFDRPARDAKRGMLPPKLARMMINLSGAEPSTSRLLDPFCGSGTVLMEALQIDFGKLVGSDISEQAIEDTKTNLEWLETSTELPSIDLHISKAGNLHALLPAASIDAVVTEPFLGKPRQGRESKADVERAVKELAKLYRESFSSIKQILSPEAKLVIASPVHMLRDDAFPVPTRQVLKELGYTELPFSEKLLYRQKGQFVARELLRFTLK